MQMKPIVRYPYTPIRMAKIKKIGTKCDHEGGRPQLCTSMGEVGQCSDTAWPCLVQLSTQMSVASVPGRVLRGSEGSGHQDTCTPMVIALLFLTAPSTKQRTWSPPAEEIIVT